MFQAFTKKLLIVFIFLLSSVLNADDYQAGKHYQILSEPVVTRDSKKIEVIEFFLFRCGACYSLENQLNSWKKDLPSDVDFWRSPITWDPLSKTHAQIFYAAEFFEKPEIISNTFISFHGNGNKLASDVELIPFFASFGIDDKEYKKLFDSFAMQNQIRRAGSLGLKYKVTSVPTFIVNGKYKVSPSKVGFSEVFDVINYLINIERK